MSIFVLDVYLLLLSIKKVGNTETMSLDWHLKEDFGCG